MKVICSNCGKYIPYHGKVCPYCNADKTKDKKSFDKTFSYVGSAFLGIIHRRIHRASGHPWRTRPGDIPGTNSWTAHLFCLLEQQVALTGLAVAALFQNPYQIGIRKGPNTKNTNLVEIRFVT